MQQLEEIEKLCDKLQKAKFKAGVAEEDIMEKIKNWDTGKER